jgi:hypothetical protein
MSDVMHDFETALTRVGTIGALAMNEAAQAIREAKKLRDQLDDALDALAEKDAIIRARDEIIAELQQVNSMQRTGR